MNRRAVVFDFDGVLADTEGLHLAAFQDVFSRRGWTLDRATYFERYLGFDDRDLIATFLADQSLPSSRADIDGLLIEKAARYDARVAGGLILYATAAACVRRLGADFALAIASGSMRGEILAILRANKLDDAFQAVVGADDVMHSKPAPDSYLAAVTALGVKPEHAVAIEDSQWGLTAARAAGLRTIGITTTYPRHALRLAHVVIDSLDEVTQPYIDHVLEKR